MVRPIKSSKELTVERLRSAISNGNGIFRGVDHRSASVRRFKDVLFELAAARGGIHNLTPQERVLVWRAAVLTLWLELVESRWFKRDTDQPPSTDALNGYSRCVNTLHRLLKTVGLKTVKTRPLHETTREEVLAMLGIPNGGEFQEPFTTDQIQKAVTPKEERARQRAQDAAKAR